MRQAVAQKRDVDSVLVIVMCIHKTDNVLTVKNVINTSSSSFIFVYIYVFDNISNKQVQ